MAAASLLKDHATTTVASNRTTHSKYDRANNVVLFGLPETSLMETKTAIDNMSMHLIGKSIKLVDAFRLRRKSESTSTRPRPLLIKLDNFWDRRLLLAACRKLKGYSDSRLFLREDLPPDARSRRTNTNTLKTASSESGSSPRSKNSSLSDSSTQSSSNPSQTSVGQFTDRSQDTETNSST